MRAWMINVYKQLTSLNVAAHRRSARRVRSHDRDERSDPGSRTATRVYAPLFKSAEEMGATQEEWKAYQEQNVEQTQEAAVDELQSVAACVT
jgi:hypothetical protein